MKKEKRLYSKEHIRKGIIDMVSKAMKQKYLLNATDIFALGYMFGKYNLNNWSEKELRKGTKQYDETDDLKLLDTIEETLVDLKILKSFS